MSSSASRVANFPVEAVFSARDLEHAMALVKRSLGPDALIVSSRRVERPGVTPRFEVRATLGAAPGEASTLESVEADASDRVSQVLPRTPTLLERVLVDNDVPALFARELASIEPRPARSLAELRTSLVAILRARIGFGDRTAGARIVGLCGPTGVGKTTTIAKLAARDALVNRRRVVLISMDDYRVGGADQLARFAELMDVPFAVATDATSLDAAIARYPFADRVYVDTAGRSPRDTSAIDRTATTLSAVGAATLIALPASVRSAELSKILAQHAGLAPRGIVMTKLDEAELVGGALSAALASGLPLVHFATGQRVPEDLEPASAERLASMLLGEGGVR